MFSLSRQWVQILAATALSSALAIPALAGPTPDYGHDFVTIGDPGNRPVNKDEGRRFFPPFATEDFGPVGRVNYRYRMTRSEVTVSQWAEFVNAYAPYYDGPANWSEFTSSWVVFDGDSYQPVAGSENFAANMGWRYAARYCNWLTNGKGSEQAAFENGAYDTSTFGQNPDGTYSDQREHNPDALFWIPTLDEWTKGMHWDPNANGGEGGYWRYPHSSNLVPEAAPPGIGDTNAGLGDMYDVGSYAHAASPWGLLDGSGGQSEWLESGENGQRYLKGTSWALGAPFDEIDRLAITFPTAPLGGLRLVSAIPGPGGICILVLAAAAIRRSR